MKEWSSSVRTYVTLIGTVGTTVREISSSRSSCRSVCVSILWEMSGTS
jgi:hypothetical protein